MLEKLLCFYLNIFQDSRQLSGKSFSFALQELRFIVDNLALTCATCGFAFLEVGSIGRNPAEVMQWSAAKPSDAGDRSLCARGS